MSVALLEPEMHVDLHDFIALSPDLICAHDLDGHILSANPAASAATGYSVAELARMRLHDLLTEPAQWLYPSYIDALVTTGQAVGRMEIRTRGGQLRLWEYRNVLLSPTVAMGVARDVTERTRAEAERKMLEQQLEQTHRVDSLGRLAATVAHEFNNVLMGMQPFAELLQKRTPTPELVARASQHILNSIQRGKCVTHDLLRYTRPAEPTLQPLALDAWWNGFVAEAQAMIGDHIALKAEIEPLAVMADARQLAQVFANLISNAGDAMREGGDLRVRVCDAEPGFIAESSRFVQITVRDTGTGMPPDVLAHAFDPLFTTKANGGTGLGLAVAHQVVTRHGGFIVAESEVGRGSAFHIFLPKVAAAAPPVSGKSERPRVAGRRILIVEDEELIAVGLYGLLADDGFETSIASTGAQALDALDALAPDLVLLDIGLPDLDGTEVARRIHARQPALPVIFMTGHGDARGDAMLQKPFELDELLDRIAELEKAS